MAGALAYPRRRFVPLTGVGAVAWSLFSLALGLGAGVWFASHPLVAIGVGVLAGVAVGFAVDRLLTRVQRRAERRNQLGTERRARGATEAEITAAVITSTRTRAEERPGAIHQHPGRRVARSGYGALKAVMSGGQVPR